MHDLRDTPWGSNMDCSPECADRHPATYPGKVIYRLLADHFPFIRFQQSASPYRSPYLACGCGWEDLGDTGWTDHLNDAVAKP